MEEYTRLVMSRYNLKSDQQEVGGQVIVLFQFERFHCLYFCCCRIYRPSPGLDGDCNKDWLTSYRNLYGYFTFCDFWQQMLLWQALNFHSKNIGRLDIYDSLLSNPVFSPSGIDSLGLPARMPGPLRGLSRWATDFPYSCAVVLFLSSVASDQNQEILISPAKV